MTCRSEMKSHTKTIKKKKKRCVGLYKPLKALTRNPFRCHFLSLSLFFFFHSRPLIRRRSQQRACICGFFQTNTECFSSGDGAFLPMRSDGASIRGELPPPPSQTWAGNSCVVTVTGRSLRMQFCPSSNLRLWCFYCRDANHVGPGPQRREPAEGRPRH